MASHFSLETAAAFKLSFFITSGFPLRPHQKVRWIHYRQKSKADSRNAWNILFFNGMAISFHLGIYFKLRYKQKQIICNCGVWNYPWITKKCFTKLWSPSTLLQSVQNYVLLPKELNFHYNLAKIVEKFWVKDFHIYSSIFLNYPLRKSW